MVQGDRPFRVLIAGAGVAALEAMVALRELAGERVHVEVLAPETEFVYRPLAVAEPFDLGTVHRFSLRALTGACGAHHLRGELAGVDPQRGIAHTGRLVPISYDALLIAVGVRAHETVRGALTFRGPEDVAALQALLGDIEAGRVRRVVFAAPGDATWALPLYELALLTADRLARSEGRRVEVVLVTAEEEPLQIFGGTASEAVRSLLEEKQVAFLGGRHPSAFEGGELLLIPDGVVEADAAVALPSLWGQTIPGIPHDRDDFIETDPSGRVEGLESVWAAGDITSFPVKQGGLATQQADAAAEDIAARAGADVQPRPFEPILRGLVVTGGAPQYLRVDMRDSRLEFSIAHDEPLWSPPGKIAGRFLGPFLAEQAGLFFRSPDVA